MIGDGQGLVAAIEQALNQGEDHFSEAVWMPYRGRLLENKTFESARQARKWLGTSQPFLVTLGGQVSGLLAPLSQADKNWHGGPNSFSRLRKGQWVAVLAKKDGHAVVWRPNGDLNSFFGCLMEGEVGIVPSDILAEAWPIKLAWEQQQGKFPELVFSSPILHFVWADRCQFMPPILHYVGRKVRPQSLSFHFVLQFSP
jgi:hypothetical protein